MTAVKTLVAVMTLMLLGGLGLLAYGMAQQSSKLGHAEGDAVPSAPGGGGPLPRFEALTLGEPAGSAIAAVTAGPQGRLILTVTGGGRADRVVVIDLGDGRRLGVVSLEGGRHGDDPEASR